MLIDGGTLSEPLPVYHRDILTSRLSSPGARSRAYIAARSTPERERHQPEPTPVVSGELVVRGVEPPLLWRGGVELIFGASLGIVNETKRLPERGDLFRADGSRPGRNEESGSAASNEIKPLERVVPTDIGGKGETIREDTQISDGDSVQLWSFTSRIQTAWSIIHNITVAASGGHMGFSSDS